MRIGVRAHDFGRLPVEELAKRISEKGMTCIQLALSKALAGVNTDFGKLSPGMANYIGEVFHKHNIQIAVLGCYINPVNPDLEERRLQLERFKEHIRYARDFGCSLVATETGSLNADYSFNPENRNEKAFQTLLESVGELVHEAEKFGVFVGIEGVEKYIISSPQKMKSLIDNIKSNNLQVVFDPINYLSGGNCDKQDDIIRESFELFGDRMAIIHVKDYINDNGRIVSAQIGRGRFNYKLLLELLKVHKPFINVLMEETRPETIDESHRYILNLLSNIV